MPDDVISCLSSDDDESVPGDTADGGADSQKENVENGSRDGAAAAGTKPPPPLLGEAAEDEDEDVEVVDASTAPRWNAVAANAATAATAAGGGKAASSANDGDDDEEEEELEIVGTANEQKFPHSRQDCLEFRYQAATNNDNAGGGNDNATFCPLCYCYVCDKPASECGEWYRGGKGTCQPVAASVGETDNATATAKSTGEEEEVDGKPKADDASSSNSSERNKPYKNHCDATDKGPHSQLWQNMRRAVREGRDPSLVTHAPEPSGSALDSMQQWLANYGPPNPASSYSYGSGGAGFGRNDRHAHRLPATAQGGARQMRRRDDSDSTHGGTSAAAGMYASASYEAARAATAARGRSRSAPARRRVRSSGGGSGNGNSSSGSKRPAPHDHRQRIRTQAMLEDLYG